MRTWKGEALLKELARLETMKEYERLYADDACICGIDEAGRGPLAGPVVAAAVVLPKECGILGLNDSKKLSPARREALYKEIREKAVSFGVGVVSPGVIDEINILQATYEAMRQAVSALTVSPDRDRGGAAGEYRERGREERFHSGRQYFGQGRAGSYDGGV